MILSLNVRSIELMTNNPRKVEQLTQHGVRVARRVPHLIPPNLHNRFYLETKRDRSGHYIDFSGKRHLMEQSDPVLIDGMTES
jgi:GTP cyclohydrolase II